MSAAPPIETVVETGLYADDLDAAEAFYAGVLGLPLVARMEGRHLFFRVGTQSMLLVFRPEQSLAGDDFPAHGARGPGHFALGIRRSHLDDWRRRLTTCGVAIEQERTWPLGGASIYFRDPAGNLCELITPGVWGTPAGW